MDNLFFLCQNCPRIIELYTDYLLIRFRINYNLFRLTRIIAKGIVGIFINV
jgi:hypothetical protein